MKPLAPDRVRCCVPGCGRTFKANGDYSELMCGRHYRLADKNLRQAQTWLLKRWRKAKTREAADRIARIHDRGWEMIKRQAIERAVGL